MAAKNACVARAVVVLSAAVLLPLLGARWSGVDPGRFFRFPPPLDLPRNYPQFSWIAAAAVAVLLAVFAGSWLRHARRATNAIIGRSAPPSSRSAAAGRRNFPAWGAGSAAWTLAWWFIAWTRLPVFAWVQPYTFFPLWLGFIVTVNALTDARAGTCLMRRVPARWLALFAGSAAFWWLFEWLNRFVQNWHYLAVEEFGPVGYALHATLCFSTVLPAVAAVREYLGTWPGFAARCADGPAWPWLGHRMTGVLLIGGATAALLGTGARPREFYPALWLAPLALWWGAGLVARAPGEPDRLARGDWHAAGPWMLAALVCGFWWELWNWHSLARWIYTVPYVDRWHVFEMPLLGYAGYLSFGLECLSAVEFVTTDDAVAPASTTRAGSARSQPVRTSRLRF